MGCDLSWATTHLVLRPGRCSLGGEESQVLLDPRRIPGMRPLSSHLIFLPFVCDGKPFSEVVVSLSCCSQGRLGNLGTRAHLPGEA